MKEVMEQAAYLSDLKKHLKSPGAQAADGEAGALETQLEMQVEGRRKLLEKQQTANTLSDADRKKHRLVIRFLEECRRDLAVGAGNSGEDKYGYIKEKYNAQVADMKRMTEEVQGELHSLFVFVEEAFGQGNEMLVLVTDLTVDGASAQFIAAFGSPDYGRHSKELMLNERRDSIQEEIAALGL